MYTIEFSIYFSTRRGTKLEGPLYQDKTRSQQLILFVLNKFVVSEKQCQ